MSYQLNLVVRQFGLSQMVPKPMVSHDIDIVWSGRSLTTDDHKACLRFCKSTNRYELPVFRLQPFFLETNYFDEWWNSYHSQAFPSDQFLQNMVDALFTLTGDIPPPPPSVNTPDPKIQNPKVDEAPKKVHVTDLVSSFHGVVPHQRFFLLGSKKGRPFC